jgi:hypothetical protein
MMASKAIGARADRCALQVRQLAQRAWAVTYFRLAHLLLFDSTQSG